MRRVNPGFLLSKATTVGCSRLYTPPQSIFYWSGCSCTQQRHSYGEVSWEEGEQLHMAWVWGWYANRGTQCLQVGLWCSAHWHPHATMECCCYWRNIRGIPLSEIIWELGWGVGEEGCGCRRGKQLLVYCGVTRDIWLWVSVCFSYFIIRFMFADSTTCLAGNKKLRNMI